MPRAPLTLLLCVALGSCAATGTAEGPASPDLEVLARWHDGELHVTLRAHHEPLPPTWVLGFGPPYPVDWERWLRRESSPEGAAWSLALTHHATRPLGELPHLPRPLDDEAWALPGRAFLPQVFDARGSVDPFVRLRFELPNDWGRVPSHAYVAADASIALRMPLSQARDAQWWIGKLSTLAMAQGKRTLQWITPKVTAAPRAFLELGERALTWFESWDPGGAGRWAVMYHPIARGLVMHRQDGVLVIAGAGALSGDATAAEGAALLRALAWDARDAPALRDELGEYLALLAQLQLSSLNVPDGTRWSMDHLQARPRLWRWFCADTVLRRAGHSLPEMVGRARGRLLRREALDLARLQREWERAGVSVSLQATNAAACWSAVGVRAARQTRSHPGDELWMRALGVEDLAPHRLEVMHTDVQSPLRAGDRILRLWDEPLVEPEDLAWVLATRPALSPLQLDVLRGDDWISVEAPGLAWVSTGEQERWVVEEPLPAQGWWTLP